MQLDFEVPSQLAHLENGKSNYNISEQHGESFPSLWCRECVFSVLFIKYAAQLQEVQQLEHFQQEKKKERNQFSFNNLLVSFITLCIQAPHSLPKDSI